MTSPPLMDIDLLYSVKRVNVKGKGNAARATKNLQISYKETENTTFLERGIVIRCIRKIMRCCRNGPKQPPLEGRCRAMRGGEVKKCLPAHTSQSALRLTAPFKGSL